MTEQQQLHILQLSTQSLQIAAQEGQDLCDMSRFDQTMLQSLSEELHTSDTTTPHHLWHARVLQPALAQLKRT
jgi:hypothetical protein